ncbi:hypothetical protein ACWGA9_32250 [Streptomyces sp. NPDC054950]
MTLLEAMLLTKDRWKATNSASTGTVIIEGATATGRHQAVDLYGLRRQQRVLLPVGPLTEHPTPAIGAEQVGLTSGHSSCA